MEEDAEKLKAEARRGAKLLADAIGALMSREERLPDGRVRKIHPLASIGYVASGPNTHIIRLECVRGYSPSAIVSRTQDIRAESGVPVTFRLSADGLLAEFPRRHRAIIRFSSLDLTAAPDTPLPIPVGMPGDGQPRWGDLAALAHLLVAGATGSGKSVWATCYLLALMLLRGPDAVRFVLVDPKIVELAPFFEGAPHLVTDPITEPMPALAAVDWLVQEMDTRYAFLAQKRCKNIQTYHETYPSEKDIFPYLVAHIDECYDLFLAAQAESKETRAALETALVRIAQKGRAAGIHLVICTQKPTNEAIPSLLKANLPNRIAFRVFNETDSRVILDTDGAERLLGKGDGLFSENGELTRIQGYYLTDQETSHYAALAKTKWSGVVPRWEPLVTPPWGGGRRAVGEEPGDGEDGEGPGDGQKPGDARPSSPEVGDDAAVSVADFRRVLLVLQTLAAAHATGSLSRRGLIGLGWPERAARALLEWAEASGWLRDQGRGLPRVWSGPTLADPFRGCSSSDDAETDPK